MSKLANRPISYPEGLSAAVVGGFLQIKSEKKTVSIKLNSVSVVIDDIMRMCTFSAIDDKKQARANLGTCVANFKSALSGFERQYSLNLTAQGVGFKAVVIDGNRLLMWLGRSHLYCVNFPGSVDVVAKDNKISLSGDKLEVTMLAAIIKTNRSWDPCMKKGIVIDGEFLVHKEGKKKK